MLGESFDTGPRVCSCTVFCSMQLCGGAAGASVPLLPVRHRGRHGGPSAGRGGDARYFAAPSIGLSWVAAGAEQEADAGRRSTCVGGVRRFVIS